MNRGLDLLRGLAPTDHDAILSRVRLRCGDAICARFQDELDSGAFNSIDRMEKRLQQLVDAQDRVGARAFSVFEQAIIGGNHADSLDELYANIGDDPMYRVGDADD